jgi:hypothetical protein
MCGEPFSVSAMRDGCDLQIAEGDGHRENAVGLIAAKQNTCAARQSSQ